MRAHFKHYSIAYVVCKCMLYLRLYTKKTSKYLVNKTAKKSMLQRFTPVFYCKTPIIMHNYGYICSRYIRVVSLPARQIWQLGPTLQTMVLYTLVVVVEAKEHVWWHSMKSNKVQVGRKLERTDGSNKHMTFTQDAGVRVLCETKNQS